MSFALDAAIDELTGHTEFFVELADLLRRAQARLQTSHAAECLRTGSRLKSKGRAHLEPGGSPGHPL